VLHVLPHSAVIVWAARESAAPWRIAHVAQVAPARPHAFRTELPAGVVAQTPDPGLRLQRRSLSPDERAEIDRHIHRLRARIGPAVAATLALAIATGWRVHAVGGVRDFFTGEMSGGAGWLGWLGWAALATFAYIGYARRVVAARRLEWDRRLRWVVTVDEVAQGDASELCPKLEVLPVSQLMWTENAAPAPWRMLRL
jgi:hypothetical protein